MMKIRSKIWNRSRRVGERLIRALIPLQKVKYTLVVYYEQDVYERIPLEKLNAEIQRSIQSMLEVTFDARVDTELTDHSSGCRSGRASLYDLSKNIDKNPHNID